MKRTLIKNKVILSLIFILLLNTLSTLYLFSFDKRFLWEIKSEKSIVYLLGSIHVAKDDIYPLDTVIENAFERSDYLVVEVDIKNIDYSKVQNLSTYTDGTTLEDHLSKDVYQKLQEEFKKYKIHPTFYKKLKPWSALSLLLNAELQEYGYKSNMGIDAYFLKKSKMKAILELESYEKQINIFDNELKDVLDEFIEYSIKDIENSSKMLDSMFVFWSSGNVEGLKTLVIDNVINDIKNSKLIEILFTKRNISMTEKIEEYLNMKGTFFVIVGAGHIIGEDGILNLLNKKNKYKIRQL